ncbi:MAG: PEP-CTERM sorting domain-containing protein [Planctomycetota bacterium]
MRKLLILALVLGMASWATALPTITVSNPNPINGEVIQVYVSGTAAEASTTASIGGYSGFVAIDYAVYGALGPAGSPILSIASPPAITTAAGSYATAATTAASGPYPGIEYFFAAHLPPWTEGKDVDIGTWFTYDVTITGSAGQSEVLDLLNPSVSNIGQVTITIVPEPITMALLGLGGLFLRRRK